MKIIRNILSLVLGWLLGSLVNMGLVMLGHNIFPINGIDPNNMEELAEVMPTLEFKYFVFPFLAHALGTLTGSIVAYLIAANNRAVFGIATGFLFLVGGIMMTFMIPAPTGFIIADITLAYIPMALIGNKIAKRLSRTNR
ncbi:MAG: hypothetical protein Kow0079_08740 [Vicingaceae bacterium]